MKTTRSPFSGLLALALLLPQQPDSDGRVYGRVETLTGQVHVGFIRWFQGESSWSDLLPAERKVLRERAQRVVTAYRESAAAEPPRTVDASRTSRL